MKITFNLENGNINQRNVEKIVDTINQYDKFKTDGYSVKILDNNGNRIVESLCSVVSIKDGLLVFSNNSTNCNVIWQLITEIVIDDDAQTIKIIRKNKGVEIKPTSKLEHFFNIMEKQSDDMFGDNFNFTYKNLIIPLIKNLRSRYSRNSNLFDFLKKVDDFYNTNDETILIDEETRSDLIEIINRNYNLIYSEFYNTGDLDDELDENEMLIFIIKHLFNSTTHLFDNSCYIFDKNIISLSFYSIYVDSDNNNVYIQYLNKVYDEKTKTTFMIFRFLGQVSWEIMEINDFFKTYHKKY